MLSQTARQEILRKINETLSYTMDESRLSPATRQAITNLATVQRHLFVITEMLRGENSRVQGSFILRSAAKLGKDSGKAERDALASQISTLQQQVDKKVSDLSNQITAEEAARQSGLAPPQYKGGVDIVQLKCASCGASLPIPTARFVQCQYCKANFTIEQISTQIQSMIQGI
jgi:hypothetical protein